MTKMYSPLSVAFTLFILFAYYGEFGMCQDPVTGMDGELSGMDGFEPTELGELTKPDSMTNKAAWDTSKRVNETAVIINTQAHSFDMTRELKHLRDIYEIPTLTRSTGLLNAQDFDRQIRGKKPQFQSMSEDQIHEKVYGNEFGTIDNPGEENTYEYYYNSWNEIIHNFVYFDASVNNLISRLVRVRKEINYMMNNMLVTMFRDELERERTARIMGSAEWMGVFATHQAISAGKSDDGDSTEIGAASFIAFANFLVVLFNAVRFCKLFFKSRSTEKLVATDMTFASTD